MAPSHPKHCAALGIPTVLRWTLGLALAGAFLAACADAAPGPSSPGAAVSSPQPSYVVYPPPGTAAVENDPICEYARNTAFPVVKRSFAMLECDRLLSRATEPVTKPVISTATAPPTQPPAGPPAGICTALDLGARFGGGGFGGGNDFGEIWIWNLSPRPCRLSGAVTFAAHYADGARDDDAVANRSVRPVSLTLPSGMAAPRNGADPSAYLIARLMGPERDDPTQPNGSCRPQDERTPATFVLSLGSVTVRVTNNDPSSSQNTSVYGCHGAVLLEGVQLPQTG